MQFELLDEPEAPAKPKEMSNNARQTLDPGKVGNKPRRMMSDT